MERLRAAQTLAKGLSSEDHKAVFFTREWVDWAANIAEDPAAFDVLEAANNAIPYQGA